MSNIPAYLNPCVAPDPSTSNSVFVIGVPSSAEGRLEAYRVNLSNINSPTAVLVGNLTEYVWSSTAAKYCLNYPTDSAPSAVMVQQFGPNSYLTQLHQNGTMEPSVNFNGIAFQSPKLYSHNAANGTFASTPRPPVVGFLSVFDADGKSGSVFTASSSAGDLGATDRVQTLSNKQPIDMGGIVLTKDAYSVTQGSTGYVIDKAASDGTTILYKISPGAGSLKLTPVTVTNVPMFWPNRAVTSLGSQLVFFGGVQSALPTSTFHVYDSITNQWSGPGLVQYKPPAGPTDPGTGNGNGDKPTPPPSESSSTNTGAIIGGVVGGVVILALIGFFLFRRNKRRTTEETTPDTMSQAQQVPPPQGQYVDGSKVPPPNMMQQSYAVPASQYPQHLPTQPQMHGGTLPPAQNNTYSQYGMTAISTAPGQPGQTDQPIFFQPQVQHNAHHSYQPPILTSVEQSPHQIFQPAAAATAATSPVPSNTAYSPNAFTATPHSQTVVPNSSAGSPQYVKPPTQGYVS
ncbi:hypothetical protein BGZ73_003905 [Actinomortierella ambigua]|nr:hypothetical protein BGZ73_003905 [Actinomortierella ambigua]